MILILLFPFSLLFQFIFKWCIHMDGTKFKRFRSQSPFYSSYLVSLFNSSRDWFLAFQLRLCLKAIIVTSFLHFFPKRGYSSVQLLSHVRLCNSMDCSMPGLPVHHQLQKFTQTHVHWVGDAIQPSHLLSSPSPPTFNHSQQQDLFQWVSSSHQVAKVLEFQLHYQSFQWIFRTDFQTRIDWFDLLVSKGLSRVFSNTIVQNYQFFSTQFFLWSSFLICTWLLEKP